MKLLKQIGIIFGLCWIGEIVNHFLPFSLPAGVIGMILLFFCLLTGILKLEHVQEKSDFLLSNMAFFFVPAGVGMMNYFDVVKNNLFPILFICLITTIITFGATALSIRLTISLMRREK